MTEPTSAHQHAVDPVPPCNGAIPYLVVRGAGDAIAYYQRALGAQLVFKLDAPDGSVMHAEMTVGSARFMLCEERPQYGALSPLAVGGTSTTLVVYVADVDAQVATAVGAGARIGMPVADQFWGDRSGQLTDPFGHQWMLSTHIEDPTPQQMHERLQAMFAQQPPQGCSAAG